MERSTLISATLPEQPVELFSILIVLLTFSGRWRLVRNTSFSPLEVAKAFDAPLLSTVPSNLIRRRIAKIEGNKMVQYGLVYNQREEIHGTGCKRSERMIVAVQGKVYSLEKSRTVKGCYNLIKIVIRRRWSVLRLHEQI